MRLGPDWFRVDTTRLYMFEGGGGGAGGGGGTEDDSEKILTDAEIDAIPGLEEAGRKAIRDQRDRRKAERDRRVAAEAERDALREAKTERDALRQEKADREREDRERQEREASEAGQHQQLAESRRVELERVTGELNTAKETITTLTEANDRMSAAIDKVIEDDWKSLPDKVKDAYTGVDDAIAKMEWLPKAKALAEELEGKPVRREGHRLDREPNTTERPSLEAEVEAQTGGYLVRY